MGRDPLTLTDDKISSIIIKLVYFLDKTVPGFYEWSNDDKNYDSISDFISDLLSPYSDGYINYN